MYCDLWLQYIHVQKLFKGRNYSRKYGKWFTVFAGGGALFPIMKRAMVKKDYKEIDETIKAKVAPFLYNNGDGAMVPIAQMAYVRNRDRSERKMVSKVRTVHWRYNLVFFLILSAQDHFGVIAGLFRQIGVHSSIFVLFCTFEDFSL